MIQPSLSFRWRSLSFLPFLFALVFGLLGAAPLINNALYTSNKIFISWLLIDFQSDNQWLFPIFFWAIAGGFFIFGIVLRRITSSRHIQFNQSVTAGRIWGIRVLLISILGGVYLVFIGLLCLLAFGSQAFNVDAAVYEESLFYQRHVYLLSVEPNKRGFKFEVSQCDASGWFCHSIYDASRNISVSPGNGIPLGPYAQFVDAHLQADAPHQHLFILYHGEGTSDSGKLLCPIPPSYSGSLKS